MSSPRKFPRRALTILAAAVAFAAAGGAAAAKKHERIHSDEWCGKEGGKSQARLIDGSKVDCLTADYAIEFDFGKTGSAYRCTGQAMYYAKVSERKPMCILIQHEGISDDVFESAVRRIVPPVEVRCMTPDNEMFECPKTIGSN